MCYCFKHYKKIERGIGRSHFHPILKWVESKDKYIIKVVLRIGLRFDATADCVMIWNEFCIYFDQSKYVWEVWVEWQGNYQDDEKTLIYYQSN